MHELRFAVQFLQSFTKRLRKLSFCIAHCALWIHLFSIARCKCSENVKTIAVTNMCSCEFIHTNHMLCTTRDFSPLSLC
jgi:hypothetical protein